jgi:hypothetical protein
MVSRGTKIGRAFAKRDNALRRVYFDGECLKVLTGSSVPYTTQATYADNWYLDRKEYSDVVAGKKYKRLVIDDVEGCRLESLKLMTAVAIAKTGQVGPVFKFHAKDSFIGSVPSYEFRVYPTGEQHG